MHENPQPVTKFASSRHWQRLISTISSLGILFLPQMVHAQVTDPNVLEVGQAAGIAGGGDLLTIIANVINILLGLLGVIFLILILYSGYLWMTAAGDTKKVEEAQARIRNAVIGLVVISLSWAITSFVFDALLSAQDGAGNISGSGGGSGGGGFGTGGGSKPFRVTSIQPSGAVSLKNVEVKIIFNKPVDAKTLAAITVAKMSDGTSVAGQRKVDGLKVIFTPDQACAAPNTTLKCFDENTEYTVTVGAAIRSVNAEKVTCSNANPCSGTFTSGSLIDTTPPLVALTFPTPGMSISVDSFQQVQAEASDDAGVAFIDFVEETNTYATVAPKSGTTPLKFNASADWDTTGVTVGVHRLLAKAADIDAHTAQSAAISVVVRPAHCFNGVQDAPSGEMGIDCGGGCGACAGGSCSENADCANGFCDAQQKVCVVQPVISKVSPGSGAVGTFVTIQGANFGTAVGKVKFLGDPVNIADDVEASIPPVCVKAGYSGWAGNQVVVAVPANAKNGPIQLLNSQSNLQDRTDDPTGPKIADFVVNDVLTPGLCGLNPKSGFVGITVEAAGIGFGSANQKILFGEETELGPLTAKEDLITFKVPVVNAGVNSVAIKTPAGISNAVTFLVMDKSAGVPPSITVIDPPQGTKEEYITIYGKNFGNTIGSVIFTNAQSKQEAVGSTAVPEQCSGLLWKDSQIVVKVPLKFLNNQDIASGAFAVSVKRTDTKVSNEVNFAVLDGAAGPGLCAILPAAGPEQTAVTLVGERLASGQPEVTFANQKLATIAAGFTSQEVKTTVPAGAVTGKVVLKASGKVSNGLDFAVGNCNTTPELCGVGEQCCVSGSCVPSGQSCGAGPKTAQFAWQASTGELPVAPYVIEECKPLEKDAPLPSPSPWDRRSGGNQVPTDSAIVMRFSQILDAATVNVKNFTLYSCTGKGLDPCAERQLVNYPGLDQVKQANDQDVVRLKTYTGSDQEPNKDPSKLVLQKNTRYMVFVSQAVRAAAEPFSQMEKRSECGTGKDGVSYGYCFQFQTRDSDVPTQVNEVKVLPSNFLMDEVEQKESYSAAPLNADDRCLVVSCETKNWSWHTGDPAIDVDADPRATISKLPNLQSQSCIQAAKAVTQTGTVNPVLVNARVVQASPVIGTGKLTIAFRPPRVISYGPHCDLACRNAAAWVQFSAKLDPTTVTEQTVVIKKCPSENCHPEDLENLPPILGTVKIDSNDSDFLAFEPLVDQLQAGAYYHVLLRSGPNVPNGITGIGGMPIEGLNHPDGYSWKFRVKLDPGSYCAADRVEVKPVEKYEDRVGARQLFRATPYGAPDSCSKTGQLLVAEKDASWNVADQTVAKLYTDANGSLLQSTASAPTGCTSHCTLTGAPVAFADKGPICGDGLVEDARGEECEPGIPPFAASCQPNCLLNADPKFASESCGNGVLEATKGEECDFENLAIRCYGPKTLAEGVSCGDAASAKACVDDGGSCERRNYRGCSVFCRHLGAAAGGSTCGNGEVGDGEDCDDGNSASGDGCSYQCLNEGSKPTSVVFAVCGNGVLESGEACETTKDAAGKPTPFAANSGCDAKTCLHTGSTACVTANGTNCCGNTKVEVGESCDDGNSISKDGCSQSCLFEGSSAYYADALGNPAPSFCGDATTGIGEEPSCKLAQKPAGSVIDATQLAYIVGDAEPDAEGLMSTKLSVIVSQKEGNATYGLVCGKTSELDCPAGFGLDTRGCCSARPAIKTSYPEQDQAGVCRNVQLTAAFDPSMDTGSVVNNAQVLERVSGTECPAGSVKVAEAEVNYPAGIRGLLARIWDWIRVELSGTIAWAQQFPITKPVGKIIFKLPGGSGSSGSVWCANIVTGQWKPVIANQSSSLFFFTLDATLKPNTWYMVRFVGDPDLTDNAQVQNRVGVKTSRGVVQAASVQASGPLSWSFQTGADICQVSEVSVNDVTPAPTDGTDPHPYLFLNKGNNQETRNFVAEAQSIQAGYAVPLSPTKEYAWEWDWWTSNRPDVVKIADTVTAPADRADATSQQRSGQAILTATLSTSLDLVFNEPGKVIQGTAPVTVITCQNPWPTLGSSPFRDMANSPSRFDLSNTNAADPFGPNYFNFSFQYCRDAGDEVLLSDDIPAMRIALIPPSAVDLERGILRQYLLTYPDSYPQYKRDGIGIRITSNPQHLSIRDWYRSQGFTGQPEAFSIDGYEGVRDGSTVYISALNRQPGTDLGAIYSNVFVFSHNPDAGEITKQVFSQLVNSLTFNINLQNQSNVCAYVNLLPGKPFISPDVNGGRPIACSTDWDCLKYGNTNVSCASQKLKLQRDLVRYEQFHTMASSLESVKQQNGSYPKASAGTFLPGYSNSRWASWNQEIGGLAQDPINRLIACGRCSIDISAPCQSASDCKAGQQCVGGYIKPNTTEWVSDAAIDPSTCWNASKSIFSCPRFGAAQTGASRVYQYQTLDGGTTYRLSAEFEVPPSTKLGTKWWEPALTSAHFRCVTPESQGRACSGENEKGDAECRNCSGEACKTMPVKKGACLRTGGTFIFQDSCKGTAVAQVGSCGDGILNPNEKCELNESQYVSCATPSKQTGQKRQICVACQGFQDDAKNPTCYPKSSCGDASKAKTCVDPATGQDWGVACTDDAYCQNEIDVTYKCLPGKEVCDDGALNGTYGHCNATCTGYGGYCGDGKLSPGETCDAGSENGKYGAACSIDCQGKGPYCGNSQTDTGEECDGQGEVWAKAICVTKTGAMTAKVCSTSADCGTGEACGGIPAGGMGSGVKTFPYDGGISAFPFVSCEGITAGGRNTHHIRSCGVAGSQTACKFFTWSGCVAIGSCGDGILDQGEECDNGKSNADTAACTASCKKNFCGDGKPNIGVEECDAGTDNGKVTCNAEYGTTCLSCGNSCKFLAVQGGYCGNGKKEAGEACDPKGVTTETCSVLGYDYALNSSGSAFATCSNSCSFSGCGKCSEATGDGKISAYVYDALFQQVVPNARVTLLSKGVKVDERYTNGDGLFEFDILSKRPECKDYRIAIDMYQDNPCTGESPTENCRKGYVPEFPTGLTIDEGELGGYFSYESEPFSAGTFQVQFPMSGTEAAHIDIFPRPKKGMAYVAMTWANPKPESIAPGLLHTILPVEYAYTVPSNELNISVLCKKLGYDSRLVTENPADTVATLPCVRDVNYQFQGTKNTEDEPPFARLYCVHRFGELEFGYNDEMYNGCPIEGTSLCKKDCLENLDAGEATCNAYCGLAGKNLNAAGQSYCSEAPKYEKCDSVKYGPMASYVKYAQFQEANSPVQFIFHYTTAWDGSQNLKAHLVTNEKRVTIDAPPPVGNAESYWRIGTLSNQGVFDVESSVSTESDQVHSSGMACYAYSYQCADEMYCSKPDPEYFACYGKEKTDRCAQIGGTCGTLLRKVPDSHPVKGIRSHPYYNW